jgi:hypothetical protein
VERTKEAELFDSLCRMPRLREWLGEQLAQQVKILVVNPDVEQLRKAQGQAQFIQLMLDKLATAESAAKRQ